MSLLCDGSGEIFDQLYDRCISLSISLEPCSGKNTCWKMLRAKEMGKATEKGASGREGKGHKERL